MAIFLNAESRVLIQGITGIPWLIGSIGGGEPRYVPLTIADRIVGLTAVHVMLAALFERNRTGRGEAIELPMFETSAMRLPSGENSPANTPCPAIEALVCRVP